MNKKYAVVRGGNATEWRFTKWHDTIEEAKSEATRLCQKEGGIFIVLEAVGACEIQERPVVWIEAKEEKPF